MWEQHGRQKEVVWHFIAQMTIPYRSLVKDYQPNKKICFHKAYPGLTDNKGKPVTHMESNLISRCHSRTSYYHHPLCFIDISLNSHRDQTWSWTLRAGIDWFTRIDDFLLQQSNLNFLPHGEPINPVNPVPDAAPFQWAASVVSTEDSLIICEWYTHLLWRTQPEKNTLASIQTRPSRHRERSKMKTGFPFRLDNEPHSHVSVSLCVIRHPSGLKTSSLSLQATLPNTASPLILTKNGKTAAFCISSPLCDGVIGLSVLLAAFFLFLFLFFFLTVRQLHPAGCVVGVPSVVWELCLRDAALPGGFYTL